MMPGLRYAEDPHTRANESGRTSDPASRRPLFVVTLLFASQRLIPYNAGANLSLSTLHELTDNRN